MTAIRQKPLQRKLSSACKRQVRRVLGRRLRARFSARTRAADFDIATDAKPEQVEKLFQATIAVGRKFGVIVVVEGGMQFQVATFRAEADYQDGRRRKKLFFQMPKPTLCAEISP